jgi:putative ABC transport system substrate-binding protein
MKRRAFIAGAGAAVAAWPLAGGAQQPGSTRRVGVLINGAPEMAAQRDNLAAFIESLRRLGWVEGRNLHLEIRWSGVDGAGFEPGARDLAGLEPDVIVAATTPAVDALRRRTERIPIVFTVVTDPLGQGFVAKLSKPGGNITGFSNYDAPMAGKWLGLLREVVPGLSRAMLLFNPDTAPYAPLLTQALEAAASSLGTVIGTAPFHSDDLATVVAAQGREPGSGLIVAPDSSTGFHQKRIIALAARHRVPAVYPYGYFAELGGLIAYGTVLRDLYRRAGEYVGRILKGATPGELPVQSPTQFELLINLKTARALDLTIPQSLLHLADQVIE